METVQDPLFKLYYPAFFSPLDVPVQWMLTDSGPVPLPALTKHHSEGERKAFQPLDSPLSVGMWEQSLDLACWRDEKVGGCFKGMPGTKGVQRVGAEEQHAEYMALKAKLLYWLHKDSHSKSVEKARQNDFLLRLEVPFRIPLFKHPFVSSGTL